MVPRFSSRIREWRGGAHEVVVGRKVSEAKFGLKESLPGGVRDPEIRHMTLRVPAPLSRDDFHSAVRSVFIPEI